MAKTAETYHVPVLLKTSVDGLNIKPDGIYVDVTFGGGGHSREILSRLGKGGRLYGFDQDADARTTSRRSTLHPDQTQPKPADGRSSSSSGQTSAT